MPASYAIFTRIASSGNKIESKSYRRIARIYYNLLRVYIGLSIKYADRYTRLCMYLEIHSGEGGEEELQKCACAEGSLVDSLRNKAGKGEGRGFFNRTISTLHL